MTSTLQILVLLLVVIAAVAVVAKRLQIPPAILLVITGVVLALVPGLPTVNLAPNFVLLFVLPPLVYSSAVAMSWREFRFSLRPISLPCHRLRPVHDRCDRGGHPCAAGILLERRLRFGGHCLTARSRGAAVDCTQTAASKTTAGHSRG